MVGLWQTVTEGDLGRDDVEDILGQPEVCIVQLTLCCIVFTKPSLGGMGGTRCDSLRYRLWSVHEPSII